MSIRLDPPERNNFKFISVPYYFILEKGKLIFALSYNFFPFILWYIFTK